MVLLTSDRTPQEQRPLSGRNLNLAAVNSQVASSKNFQTKANILHLPRSARPIGRRPVLGCLLAHGLVWDGVLDGNLQARKVQSSMS